jgi:hypothetical protein
MAICSGFKKSALSSRMREREALARVNNKGHIPPIFYEKAVYGTILSRVVLPAK